MSAIDTLAQKVGYTRDHVRAVMMQHRVSLGIKKEKGQWQLTTIQMKALEKIISSTSSPRYKLGETGPRNPK